MLNLFQHPLGEPPLLGGCGSTVIIRQFFEVIIRLDRMIQMGHPPAFKKSPKIGGYRGLIRIISAHLYEIVPLMD
jgi:hypothetical protein